MWLAAGIWAAIIFATSCTFIERSIFINFVERYLPAGIPRELWVNFWMYFGIFVVKGYHVTEFTILCLLIQAGLRACSTKHPVRDIYLAASLALVYAALDEWHQTFIPGRGGTWVDVCIDSAGIALASVLSFYRLRKYRKRRR
jgi:VanZ family protein